MLKRRNTLFNLLKYYTFTFNLFFALLSDNFLRKYRICEMSDLNMYVYSEQYVIFNQFGGV